MDVLNHMEGPEYSLEKQDNIELERVFELIRP